MWILRSCPATSAGRSSAHRANSLLFCSEPYRMTCTRFAAVPDFFVRPVQQWRLCRFRRVRNGQQQWKPCVYVHIRIGRSFLIKHATLLYTENCAYEQPVLCFESARTAYTHVTSIGPSAVRRTVPGVADDKKKHGPSAVALFRFDVNYFYRSYTPSWYK